METQKVPLFQKSVSVGKTLWKSQNLSQNGFFWGKHHPVPAVQATRISLLQLIASMYTLILIH